MSHFSGNAQQATLCMLNNVDIFCTENMSCQQRRAGTVTSRGACVADNSRVTKLESVCSCRIKAAVHTCNCRKKILSAVKLYVWIKCGAYWSPIYLPVEYQGQRSCMHWHICCWLREFAVPRQSTLWIIEERSNMDDCLQVICVHLKGYMLWSRR